MICSHARSYSKKRERNGAMRKKAGKTTIIVVRPRPGNPTKGVLRFGSVALRCALGRAGTIACKREGDGATPLGQMRLCHGYVKHLSPALSQSGLPLRRTVASDGWCDAVFDRNYNRPVRLPYRASAEKMLRSDCLYDVCVVLDWNVVRRVQGRGSAIFLHIARPDYQPTEGCIAISARDMTRLLPYLSAKTVLRVLR